MSTAMSTGGIDLMVKSIETCRMNVDLNSS